MLFGNKEKFAIEFEVKEIYHDKRFIGDGFFVVYIDGFMYGRKEDDATSFGAIRGTLRESHDSFFHLKNPFFHYKDFETCDKYYDCSYRLVNRYTEDNLKDFRDVYKIGYEHNGERFIVSWAQMEEAFDDGSFVLQLNEGDSVRLLGFKTSDDETYNIENVHGAIIQKEKFSSIIQEVIQELERYANM